MYALLFLPAAICFLLPLVNAIVQGCRDRREQREAEERRRIKAEAAAKAKAERAAKKAAARAAREAEAAEAPKRKRGRPRKDPEPAQEAPAAVPPVPVFKRPETISPSIQGNNAFAGQTVAFTGTLPNMPRAAAIAAVVANGGKAYETMPAGTTLLVVGDNPGMNKLDKADKWIGQVRKITPAQFEAMLKLPLTLTPDQFAAMIAAR